MPRLLSVAEFESRRFFRQANWRMVRIGELLDRTSRIRNVSQECPLVLRGLKYQRRRRKLLEKGYTPSDLGRRLMTSDPDLYYAMEFIEAGNRSQTTISLQAHLLTDLSYEEIGKRFGRDPSVIHMYEALCYDVVDRLDSVEYIAGHVIGPVFQAGLESLNQELLVKYFAYFGGPSMLNHVLYGINRQTATKTDDEVIGFLERNVSRNIRYQTATTMMLMQPNRFDVKTMLEGYVSLVNLELSEKGGSEEQSWIGSVLEIFRGINRVPRDVTARLEFDRNINAPQEPLQLEMRDYQREALSKGELSVQEMKAQLDEMTPDLTGGYDVAETEDLPKRSS